MTNLSDQPVHVVLIDDDEVAVEAVMRLLQPVHAAFPLTVFPSGEEARRALAGGFGATLLQERHLILLDINMPRMNGFEFLAWLRTEPRLHTSIVFIFSTSEAATDRWRAYQCHVAGYLAKSRLGSRYGGLLQVLTAFYDQVSFPLPMPCVR